MLSVQHPRFGDHCKAKWGLTEAEINDRWASALRDTNVPKSVDDEGWQTVAKYGTTAISSGRELEHKRAVNKQNMIEAEEHQLKGIMTSYLAGKRESGRLANKTM